MRQKVVKRCVSGEGEKRGRVNWIKNGDFLGIVTSWIKIDENIQKRWMTHEDAAIDLIDAAIDLIDAAIDLINVFAAPIDD